ncbi:MAG TPA: hypothetical protein VHL57_02185 [Flavobacteriales bacterium]|jgi:hypothetical protein|nr:hypothetical protein [Flavobacteriales bacterium]
MLLVHLHDDSRRARYVVRHVLERMLGVTVTFSIDLEEFRTASMPRLQYGGEASPGALYIPYSGALAACRPGMPEPPARSHVGAIRLFEGDDGLDVFARVFRLLSLAHEYAPHPVDQHGRLPSTEQFVVRHGLEQVPWVDHWALGLRADLLRRFPAMRFRRTYSHVLTVDVDNGLKYLGRPLHRAVGASLKELIGGRSADLRQRWAVRRGHVHDPYAALPKVLAEVRAEVTRAIAFILVQGDRAFDHAADILHPAFRQLLANLEGQAELGIHPSHASSEDPTLLGTERDRLRALVQGPVLASRQHFLRWRLPDTLRALATAGVREEHTLGFSDRIGFRAATCTPFAWYDLEREQETGLVLWPFAAMDSALRDKQGLGPGDAMRAMFSVCDAVRAVEGTFVSVWHDRFLSGDGPYAGWPTAMQQVVQYARP